MTVPPGAAPAPIAVAIAQDATGAQPLPAGSSSAGAVFWRPRSPRRRFVAKLDPAGTRLWVRQLGAQPFGYDLAQAVAADAFGNVFAAGLTNGGLDGNVNAGDYDGIVVKYQQDGTRR